MRTRSPWATWMSRTPPTGAPFRNVIFVGPASALDAESDPPLPFRTTNPTTATAIAAAARPTLSFLDCMALLSRGRIRAPVTQPRACARGAGSAGGKERRRAAGEAEAQVQQHKRAPGGREIWLGEARPAP